MASLFRCLAISLLMLSLISCQPKETVSTTLNDYNTDLESLLAFKEHATDSNGILAANWTTNTSFCNWIGISCSHRRTRVVALDLYGFSLQGTISSYLGNLSFLHELSLGNNTLVGPIPESLSRLPRLQLINLELNSLSGPIPYNFFNMSSLISIYMSTNNLTGALPSNRSLTILPRLQNISISDNQLTGQLPFIFASYFNLRFLSLSQNKLTGTIPGELGNLAKLIWLGLDMNDLSGMIPTSLGNLTQLRVLYLSYNHLKGTIPETLGNLRNLQKLLLHQNHLTGSIPVSVFNVSMLQLVTLNDNNLTGSIPIMLGKSVPELTILALQFNQLTGGLDFITSLSNCKNLVHLGVGNNELEGVIPNSVCNLSVNLQYFSVGVNNIEGNIPAGLSNLSSLYFLHLGINKLYGTIPLALIRLQKLQMFSLRSNNISGSIPFELGLMTSLSVLLLSMNLLSGPIPDSVGNLSRLQYIDLSYNMLSSSIPMRMWSLSSLIQLRLEHNNLNNIIPLQVGNMKALDILDIHMNHLSGNLSTTLGELQILTILDLSCNSFHGQIPESLGRLVNIQYLNLSHNSLSNVIPKSLASLRYLTSLDLSFNKLEGNIPNGRVFSNISIPSLGSNLGLCGSHILGFSPCPIMTPPSKRKSHLLIYILLSSTSVVVILACFYLLSRFFQRSQANVSTNHNNNALKLSEYDRISYHELVRATNNFSDANLLGKGGFGSVFKACLDNGLVVAVKVFNSEIQEAFRSFDAECQVLRMVRHRNLVKVISACSNLNFKALIFPFMANGSLEKWLYLDGCYLSLHQRLNIMVDVSLALEYLHHYHDNVVLHCDLKPSNVLLDENMVAHVADFGIAKLLLGDDSKSTVLTKTTGTIGYMAPEYGSSGKVSRKGDVYSFGIMLLEAFTRKAPTNEMFNEELSLRQWVSNAYPAATLKIVDSNLFSDNSINQQQGEIFTSTQQTLLSIIELALLCSRESPTERIFMQDVVPRLQSIRNEYLAKFSSLVTMNA